MSTADEIAALVRQGNKIEAIKLLREASGLGLKEAKDFLDRNPTAQELGLVVRMAAKPSASGAGIGSAEVRQLAAEGKMIEAIKLLREQTGLGLKDAKDVVERMRPPEAVAPAGEGLSLKWIAAAVVAVAACGALYALGIRP